MAVSIFNVSLDSPSPQQTIVNKLNDLRSSKNIQKSFTSGVLLHLLDRHGGVQSESQGIRPGRRTRAILTGTLPAASSIPAGLRRVPGSRNFWFNMVQPFGTKL